MLHPEPQKATVNPFMPGDLLHKCSLNYDTFENNFGINHELEK